MITQGLSDCSVHISPGKREYDYGNYYNENTVLYHDGEYVKASEAKIDLYSQSFIMAMPFLKAFGHIKQWKGDTRSLKQLSTTNG